MHDRRNDPASVGLPMARLRYLHAVTGTLLRSVGYEAAVRLSTLLADRIFDLHPPVRARLIEDIQRGAAAGDEPAAIRIAREMFSHTARFWTELLYVPRRFGSVALQRCTELRGDWPSLGPREPLVLISPYLGNPVIGTILLARLLGRTHVPVDAASHALVRLLAPHIRLEQRLGITLTPMPAGIAMLDSALAQSGRACLLLGARAGAAGIPQRFLGMPARFPPMPLRLARRHRARVVVWSCVRLPGNESRFSLRLHGIVDPTAQPIRSALAEVTRRMEEAILEAPGQFLWSRD